MKLECKLRKYGFIRSKGGKTESYIFIPTRKPYDKYVKLVISGDLATDTLDTIGLPNEFGDIIEVDFTPKQMQSKLKMKKGDAVD